jgi:hypothetical protein
MTELKDKIQSSLDESRMLILGAQILIGFAFAATFQPAFVSLPRTSQMLNVVALGFLLTTICLLISPSTFHQLTTNGEDRGELHSFTMHVMEGALLPFALGIGANVYVATEIIGGRLPATGMAVFITLVALVFWYGPTLLRINKRTEKEGESMISDGRMSAGATSMHDKIRHVLTEARVILPGNQALLGFQFAVTLQPGFRDLPASLKLIHLAGLALITLSTILLLSPAPYHRIVEKGEETEGFYRVAHKLVLSSLPPMAMGICSDLLVVTYKITERWTPSLVASFLMFSMFCVMWFGYPLSRRIRMSDLTKGMA